MFIFSNLAMSLDGKIATPKRTFFPLGSKEDWRHVQRLRLKCDAILMGATTLRVFRKPCLALHKSRHPVNILMSSTLDGISPQWEFFTSDKIQRVLFVSESAPTHRIQRFSKSSEIIVLKKPSSRNPIATQVLTCLKSKGIHRLLIEGGGDLMWNFVQHHLIDEYHITLTPKILGGRTAPTLVDGLGFKPSQIQNLKLKECRKLNDELYLIYRKAEGYRNL